MNIVKFSLLLSVVLVSLSCSQQNVTVEWKEEIQFPLWKGEKAGALAIVRSESDIESLRVNVSALRCNGSKISSIDASFVAYVMGDVLKDGYRQCGKRSPGQYDSVLVADRITAERVVKVRASVEQPVWVSVMVPQDAKSGVYSGELVISGRGVKRVKLPFSVEVVDRVLPDASQWKFHLDLWQNPYAVCRIFNVPLWSQEHFDVMRPVMKRLSDAGQKVITATIIDKPWNGQTEDPFGSMVVKTLNEDRTWSYDYTAFDRWVEYMMDLGINQQINCYSMIPWKMSFDYVDAPTGEVKYISGDIDSPEVIWYWHSFIQDFACHLRQKGWFEKTMIAMDERPEDVMRKAINIVRSVEPDFKFSYAGDYHDSFQSELYDMCITSSHSFPEDVRQVRMKEGKISTYYVCCAERYPNTFMISDANEAAWLGYFAAAHDFDGFLRWAYNSWTIDPDNDARFRTWPAGDCYIVYPCSSSIRFEKLIEGIEAYEKIRIIREEGKLSSRLQSALTRFTIESVGSEGAYPAIAEARKAIAEL